MTGTQRAFWSVTPEQTSSSYINIVAAAVEERGWEITPLSVRELATTTGQIVHIQWPEHVSRGVGTAKTAAKHARALGILAMIKQRRHRVVVTAHNLAPHGPSNTFDDWFRGQIHALADALVVLIPDHERQLRLQGQVASHTTVHAIRHPVEDASPVESSGVDRKSLLILGQIHPYHRILEFVDALIDNGNSRPVTVVGKIGDSDLVDVLKRRAQDNSWLDIWTGYVDHEELEPLVKQAAAVVSLQRTPFNSGGPYFSLPRHIPAVLSAGSQARSICEEVGADWAFEVPNPESQLDLESFERWLDKDRTPPELGKHSSTTAAEGHVELYESLLRRD